MAEDQLRMEALRSWVSSPKVKREMLTVAMSRARGLGRQGQ